MSVYITELEYLYFKAGRKVIAFLEKPKVEEAAGVLFKSISLANNEKLGKLDSNRLIIQRAY